MIIKKQNILNEKPAPEDFCRTLLEVVFKDKNPLYKVTQQEIDFFMTMEKNDKVIASGPRQVGITSVMCAHIVYSMLYHSMSKDIVILTHSLQSYKEIHNLIFLMLDKCPYRCIAEVKTTLSGRTEINVNGKDCILRNFPILYGHFKERLASVSYFDLYADLFDFLDLNTQKEFFINIKEIPNVINRLVLSNTGVNQGNKTYSPFQQTFNNCMIGKCNEYTPFHFKWYLNSRDVDRITWVNQHIWKDRINDGEFEAYDGDVEMLEEGINDKSYNYMMSIGYLPITKKMVEFKNNFGFSLDNKLFNSFFGIPFIEENHPDLAKKEDGKWNMDSKRYHCCVDVASGPDYSNTTVTQVGPDSIYFTNSSLKDTYCGNND